MQVNLEPSSPPFGKAAVVFASLIFIAVVLWSLVAEDTTAEAEMDAVPPTPVEDRQSSSAPLRSSTAQPTATRSDTSDMSYVEFVKHLREERERKRQLREADEEYAVWFDWWLINNQSEIHEILYASCKAALYDYWLEDEVATSDADCAQMGLTVAIIMPGESPPTADQPSYNPPPYNPPSYQPPTYDPPSWLVPQPILPTDEERRREELERELEEEREREYQACMENYELEKEIAELRGDYISPYGACPRY